MYSGKIAVPPGGGGIVCTYSFVFQKIQNCCVGYAGGISIICQILKDLDNDEVIF
jgi:hypothetical protein